ncbi:MAG: TetR/AcrR family transcriptional regulator [Anaerolineae bacterium]
MEKGFEAVTVRDITERAMVNRSTFYRHYLDKYDLLDQYLDTLQAKVAEAAQQAEEAGSMSADAVPAGLLMLIKHVQEYAAFYRVVLGKGGDQKIVQRFRQFSEARLRFMFERQSEPSDPKAPPIEMRMRCVSFAGIGAICGGWKTTSRAAPSSWRYGWGS